MQPTHLDPPSLDVAPTNMLIKTTVEPTHALYNPPKIATLLFASSVAQLVKARFLVMYNHGQGPGFESDRKEKFIPIPSRYRNASRYAYGFVRSKSS